MSTKPDELLVVFAYASEKSMDLARETTESEFLI